MKQLMMARCWLRIMVKESLFIPLYHSLGSCQQVCQVPIVYLRICWRNNHPLISTRNEEKSHEKLIIVRFLSVFEMTQSCKPLPFTPRRVGYARCLRDLYLPLEGELKREELKNKTPKLFICGHSHILKVMYDKDFNLLHLNPGAAGIYGMHQVRTMLRFEIDKDQIKNLEVV